MQKLRAAMALLVGLALSCGLSLSDAAAGEAPCLTQSGFFAAMSETHFDALTRYLAQGDLDAAARLMAAHHPTIVRLKAGVPVFLEEMKIWSGKVRIRPQGQTVSVWTNREAIVCAGR